MEKIVITGHTQGLGKALYNKLKEKYYDATVIGLSRSNGFDIDKDFTKIIEVANNADLFINNACQDSQQLKLFEKLKNKVKKMIVMGSVSRHYLEIIPTDYARNKSKLADACRYESIKQNAIPILHLDLTFLEGSEVDETDPTNFISDYNVPIKEVVNSVLFWIDNPCINQIEFRWKLTNHVWNELNRINPNLDPSRIPI